MDLPFAEDVNYWRTSMSSADQWIDRAEEFIRWVGGDVLYQAFGSSRGRSAFLLIFRVDNETYRITWPVLPTKGETIMEERSARIQAATFLYHDTKAKCLHALIFGVRAAFFEYLLLPSGLTASEISREDLRVSLFLPPGVSGGPEGDG